EAVYSSDGLPSLAVPLPPPPLPSSVGDDDDDEGRRRPGGGGGAGGSDDAIESLASDPRAAFDAFVVAAGVGGAPFPASARARRPASAAPSSTTWEDPRRRLFRLRSEVEELEIALRVDGGDGEGAYSRAEASELRSRLDALLSPAGNAGGLAAMLRGRQEDLSSVISRDVARLSAEEAARATADVDGREGDSKRGGDGGGGSSSSGGKIVYELYREGVGSKRATSESTTVPREVALEERLRRLELAVGSSSSSSSSTTMTTTTGGGIANKSILERIDEAELLVREVDASAIEKLAARAKVVRADLEAAARARSKLASASARSGVGGVGGGEDFRRVSELHAAMLELDGMSAHLPALASRLLELSTLHSNAAEFETRLGAAEVALSRSESTLASVERALARMEEGWKENVKVVERNVDRLDGLLNSLNE
ncbi:hypothetical protein ACHAW5_005954, partial [Stephanodiscus triporus]